MSFCLLDCKAQIRDVFTEKDAENVNVIFMCAVKMRNEDQAKIIDICKIWGIF